MKREPTRQIVPLSRQESLAAQRIASQLDDEGRLVMAAWLTAMIQIHDAPISNLRKTRLALQKTFASRATWPIIKAISAALAQTIKSAARKRSGRVALVTGVALAVLGGQGAGIAALGGAIAVPLWIVFGAGYAFAETLQFLILSGAGVPEVSSGEKDH